MQRISVDNERYPTWVCSDCGLKASQGKAFTVSTFHNGVCGVCGQTKAVTQPRDFFYPEFELDNDNLSPLSRTIKEECLGAEYC